jgi:NADH-quinone oxidoreductase subunit M
MFQELKNKQWLKLKDLSAREIFTLVPLAGMALFIGLYPQPFLNMIAAPAQNIMAQVGPYMTAAKPTLLQLASTFLGRF